MRTDVLGVALSAILAMTAPVLAQGRSAGPMDNAEAKFYFAEALALSEADNALTWGVTLYGPILLADPRTRQVVANQPDPEGALIFQDGAYVGVLPDNVGIANTAITWSGLQWTMLVWPLPETKYERAKHVMHELFHRIQDNIGLPAASPPNAHMDERDARIWLQLEFRALSEALLRDGDERKRACQDALLFRAHRQRLFPDSGPQERALEMNEGLAEYTGYHLCGLPPAAARARVAVRLEERERAPSGYARSFAYVTGAAYGLLLDEYSTMWRKPINAVGGFETMLTKAIGFTIPRGDLTAIVTERAAPYDGQRLIAREERRESVRLARLAQAKLRFVDGPVLSCPSVRGLNYTFNPNAVEAFDADWMIFDTLRVTAPWGILDVVEGGAFIKRPAGGSFDEVRVPSPVRTGDSLVSGPGWSLRLTPGWRAVDGPRPEDLRIEKSE